MFRAWLAALAFLPLLASAVRAQPSPLAVINRAIEAHGGEEKLTRLKARYFKIHGSLYGEKPMPFIHELFFQAPSSIRDALTVEADGQTTTVRYALHGDRGWMLRDGQVKPLPDPLLAELKEAAHLALVSGLSGFRRPDNVLGTLPTIQVGGRPALGVKLATPGYRDVALYFDEQTGLLAKVEHLTPDPAAKKWVREERFFTVWNDLYGLKTPTHVEVFRDGKKTMEADVTEFTATEHFDENVFIKP